MRSRERTRLEVSTVPACTSGAETTAVLADALDAARFLSEQQANLNNQTSATSLAISVGNLPSPGEPPSVAAAWEALKRPAGMLLAAFIRDEKNEFSNRSDREADALARQLAEFDWASGSAGLRHAPPVDRREVGAQELESLLLMLVEDTFDLFRQDFLGLAAQFPVSGATDQTLLDSDAQIAFRNGAQPRIDLARALLRGIGAKEWPFQEISLETFSRQRALEPFLLNEGWPWHEAQAEAVEASGLFRAADIGRESSMWRAWSDRANGVWPCPLEAANAALLSVSFSADSDFPPDSHHRLHAAAYLLRNAEPRKSLDVAFEEISGAAAVHGLDLAANADRFWGVALGSLASLGRLDALQWGLRKAKSHGVGASALRANAISLLASSPPQSRSANADNASVGDSDFAFSRHAVLGEWLRAMGHAQRGTPEDGFSELTRGLDLLLEPFSPAERPSAILLTVVACLIEMANCSLILTPSNADGAAEAFSRVNDDSLGAFRDIMFRATKLALDTGADPDTADAATGTTALIAAAWVKHSELAELLLAAGANPLLQSLNGDTAFDLASQPKGKAIVERWQETFRAKADAHAIRRAIDSAQATPAIATPGAPRLARRV